MLVFAPVWIASSDCSLLKRTIRLFFPQDFPKLHRKSLQALLCERASRHCDQWRQLIFNLKCTIIRALKWIKRVPNLLNFTELTELSVSPAGRVKPQRRVKSFKTSKTSYGNGDVKEPDERDVVVWNASPELPARLLKRWSVHQKGSLNFHSRRLY